MKIGLGAAQFGLNYGISNLGGRTSEEEVVKILEDAARNGIRIIDTAALYGMSEEILGKLLPLNHSFDIITKTIKFSKPHITLDDVHRLEDGFFQSLQKMKQSSVYGLLIHHADDLLVANGHLLMEKMLDLKQLGLVEKVGVSIYTGEQIDQILNQYRLDLIQLPLNILDQRLLLDAHLVKLKKVGTEIHSRSPFLQGLLLMEPEKLKSYPSFIPIIEHLKNYHNFIRCEGILPVQAAIGFVLDIEKVDYVICGVNNYEQFQEICSAKKVKIHHKDYSKFAICDESILNPAKWSH